MNDKKPMKVILIAAGVLIAGGLLARVFMGSSGGSGPMSNEELSKQMPQQREDLPQVDGSPGIILSKGGSLEGAQIPSNTDAAPTSTGGGQ